MTDTVLEKIIEYLHSKGHGVPEAYDGDAVAILSIVREAVSAVKPKEKKTPYEERFDDQIVFWDEGYNQSLQDYHDALMEVLS